MSELNNPEVKSQDLDLADREALPFLAMPPAPPIIMDDERFEAEEHEREQAFNSEPEWKGKPLQPFAVSRKGLFYQQRLAVGAPDLSDVLGDTSAFIADAIRILFYCSHHPSEYLHLRSKPLVLQTAIDKWGDEQIKNEADELKASALALRMFNDSEVNRSEAIPTGGPGREEELGN
jgi:hypothetical protein